MNIKALVEIHNALAQRLATGDERGAEEILRERFLELPEKVQGVILGRAYTEAVQDEIWRTEIATDILKKGVAAMEVLELLKKELAKEVA